MILKFDNTLTNSSYGPQIIQLDRDEIILVKVRDKMKKDFPFDIYLGMHHDGAYSDLYRYFMDIKSRDGKITSVEFLDMMLRNQAIDQVFMEMTIPQMQVANDNKFYKKDFKDKMAAMATPKRKPSSRGTRIMI